MATQDLKEYGPTSLPAIQPTGQAAGTGAGSQGGAPLSKKTKYSLNADSRDPAAMQRARRYVTQLAQTAPARSGAEAGGHADVPATGRRRVSPQHPRHGTADGVSPPPAQPATACTFHLSPAESYVVAQKESTAERWRSSLLRHEADLRELVVTNSTSHGEQPPSTTRVVKALKIYDAVCRASEDLSPHLAEMLRLFRIEFCRAIFAKIIPSATEENGKGEGSQSCDAAAGADSDGSDFSFVPYKHLANASLMEQMSEDDVSTYFDQVGSLFRENALLMSEVADGNCRSRIVELAKEIEGLNERVKLYECELDRLARQNEHLMDQCRKTREELVAAKLSHESKMASNEKELQALNVENKDLQLQLFRLRKQVAGGKSGQLKDAYHQMKMDKTRLLTTLFSEGDERIVVLVTLSQLESRLNEILDRYDDDFTLTPPPGHAELRDTMGKSVTVLLEEMHLCEQNYRRLVPSPQRDPTSEEAEETDGYVAILFDEKIYENLLAREGIKQRLRRGADLLIQHEETLATRSETMRSEIASHHPPSADVEGDDSRAANEDGAGASLNDLFLKSSFAHDTHDGPVLLPVPLQSPICHTSHQARRPQQQHQPHQSTFAATAGHDAGGNDGTAARVEDLVFLKRAEWVDRIFAMAPQDLLLQQVRTCLVKRSRNGVLSPEELLPRLLRRPLHDLSETKFLSSIDVFCGQDPVQQRRLCTVHHIDPSIPIQLPEHTNFMKFKYRSSNAPAAATTPRATQEDARTRSHGVSTTMTASTRSGTMLSALGSDGKDAVPQGSSYMSVADVDVSSGRASRAGQRQFPSQQQLQERAAIKRKSVRQSNAAATGGNSEPVRASDEFVESQLKDWGGKTSFRNEGVTDGDNANNAASAKELLPASRATVVGKDYRGLGSGPGFVGGNPTNGGGVGAVHSSESENIFNIHENLRVFRELTNPALMKSGKSDQQKAAATSSTTAATVAFQRLNPLSPNRGPEWSVYKALFGGFRSLTPRMIEVTTIDHMLMSACERHFTRMEYRYESCRKEANVRATNSQMSLAMTERFFREVFELTDFQEALIDELEARYCFPELVAKTMYEILCYLDAMAHTDDLLGLYLNVIRGFQPPTHLHYITYMLFHLSYCWPTSNPSEEISHDDALTVLRYLYRNADSIVHVDIHEVLRDYQMTTRSAPLTFVSMRKFMAAAMMHQEECLLLYLNGLFSSHCASESVDRLTYENYEEVASKHWLDRAAQKSVVRFLSTGVGLDRGPLLSVRDLAAIASSEWCSNLWN